MTNEKERKIKDARFAEAVRKDLMGMEGQIGIVVKYLGESIIDHATASMEGYSISQNLLPDFYGMTNQDPDEENEMPYAYHEDVEEPIGGGFKEERNYDIQSMRSIEVGRHFDGIRRGIHMEIWYKIEEAELSLFYKGNCVFKELAGDLKLYIPMKEWEDIVKSLFVVANKKQKASLVEDKRSNKQEVERRKSNWFKEMRSKWGF